MLVRFEKYFSFNTEYSTFKCRITLQLPAVGGQLQSELQSNVILFDEPLCPYWGASVKDTRQERLELENEDLTTLIEEVEKKIAETVKALKEVKEKNLTAIKAVPWPSVYEAEI